MKVNYVFSYTNDKGKHFALFTQSDMNYNQYSFIKCWEKHSDLGEMNIAHICKTKKEAEELARYWNECYKNNGTLNELRGCRL